MSHRTDMSYFLIHFTQGDDEVAFQNLKSIISSKRISADNRLIRGGHMVSCFTETPLDCIREIGGIKNETGHTKYAPYGVMFSKKDVYQRGGRPIIYSESDHYDLLHPTLQWRFMRYEPTFEKYKGVDFSWEREWRIPGNFEFSNIRYWVVVPSIEVGEKLKSELNQEAISIYLDCQNQAIEYIDYTDWRNDDDCIEEDRECPPPEQFDQNCLICMDYSC